MPAKIEKQEVCEKSVTGSASSGGEWSGKAQVTGRKNWLGWGTVGTGRCGPDDLEEQ